jgi:Uma2 family endonuclease
LGHSGIALNIAYLLEHWNRRAGKGRVYSNEAGLITQSKPATVRGADVAFFSFKRLPRRSEPSGFSAVPPELVVEIIGKGQGWRKMVEKAGEYLRMGVDRVWIVDPKRRSLTVLRPDDEPTVLSEGQAVIDAKILPGFRCRVREFFA